MPTAKHWRIRFVQGSSSQIGLVEFNMFDASSNDLRITASGVINSWGTAISPETYPLSNLYDNNTGSVAIFGLYNSLIGFEFASDVEVSTVQMSISANIPLLEWTRLEYSNNGIDWFGARVGLVSGTWGANQTVTINAAESYLPLSFISAEGDAIFEPLDLNSAIDWGQVNSSSIVISDNNRDNVFGGDKKIVGYTKVLMSPSNLPVSRKVVLIDQLSGVAVRSTWSVAETGLFKFERIADRIYYIVSFDHTKQFNGVIATDVVPENM